MLCWVGAGFSFWGAATLLAIWALLETAKAHRRARNAKLLAGRSHLGQPA